VEIQLISVLSSISSNCTPSPQQQITLLRVACCCYPTYTQRALRTPPSIVTSSCSVYLPLYGYGRLNVYVQAEPQVPDLVPSISMRIFST